MIEFFGLLVFLAIAYGVYKTIRKSSEADDSRGTGSSSGGKKNK